jgi:pyrroloquinoline quinone biosynthesis protein B
MSRASTRVPCGLLLILPVIAISSAAHAASLPPVRAVVLGIAQDGGIPHIGCTQPLCVRARREAARRERVACLGLIDDRAGERFLIDATPDLPSQLESLNRGRALADPRRPVDGILLTHAHIGHYTGLMYLGREALGARAVPVYATARMASLLRTSGPWSQLVALGQIEIREIEPGREVVLTPSLAVTPVRVPHRDELSDTVGYVVRGPGQSLLYVPDIDKWEKWDRRVEDEVAQVGIALLDGTFLSADELPGRSLAEVPHPTVGETTARLAALSSRVSFIHLNHTNPLLREGRARHDLARRGFALAADGRVFSLESGR